MNILSYFYEKRLSVVYFMFLCRKYKIITVHATVNRRITVFMKIINIKLMLILIYLHFTNLQIIFYIK